MWKKCQNFQIWTRLESFRVKKTWNSKPNLGVHFGWNWSVFFALKSSKWIQILKFWHFFHITFNARHFLCYEKFQKNPKIQKMFEKTQIWSMQDFNFCWFFITRGHWSCPIAQFASYIFLAKFLKGTAVYSLVFSYY